MAIEDNIREIYDDAVAKQRGAWSKIRDLRAAVIKDIEENLRTAGKDNHVTAAAAKIRSINPALSEDEVNKRAFSYAVEERTRERFVEDLKGETSKSTGKSIFANVANLFSGFKKISDGGIMGILEVAGSNFMEDFKATLTAFREWRAGNKEAFGKHARDNNVAHKLGITDEAEKARIIAMLDAPSTGSPASGAGARQQSADERLAELAKGKGASGIAPAQAQGQPPAGQTQAPPPVVAPPPAPVAAAARKANLPGTGTQGGVTPSTAPTGAQAGLPRQGAGTQVAAAGGATQPR